MSTFISKISLPILAGVAGTLFLSYCIYFDSKRRSAPEFKKKLRDRRKNRKNRNKDGSTALPDLKDHEAVQQFFLREVRFLLANFAAERLIIVYMYIVKGATR